MRPEEVPDNVVYAVLHEYRAASEEQVRHILALGLPLMAGSASDAVGRPLAVGDQVLFSDLRHGLRLGRIEHIDDDGWLRLGDDEAERAGAFPRRRGPEVARYP